MSYRGRGRYRGGYAASTPFDRYVSRRDDATSQSIALGLSSTPLQTLPKPSTTVSAEDVVLKNFQYVSSYNWIESPSPTIIVPGSPPHWQEKDLPIQVSPDRGEVFIDQNSHRMPSSLLLPLFKAVDDYVEQTGDPVVDWRFVDFVTDRNNLLKLLKWIGSTEEKPAGDFRIDFQLAGTGTVLFNRWEANTTETCEGFSYGYNFEKKMTKNVPGCERNTGHHRIVTYDFDGMEVVMRCEVDACYPTNHSTPSRSQHSRVDDDDALTNAFSSLSVSGPSPSSTDTADLRIIRGGEKVPQSSILKLKTRSQRAMETFDWADIFPQMFFAQTPRQIIGVHNRGNFTELRERDLRSEEMKKVERRCQPGLKRLRRVLEVIRDIAIEHGKDARLSLLCRNGVLQVMERKGAASCLPKEVIKRFD